MSRDDNVTFHYGLQQRVEHPAPPRAGTSRQSHYFFPPHSRVSSESLPLSRQLLPTSWSWHETECCLLCVCLCPPQWRRRTAAVRKRMLTLQVLVTDMELLDGSESYWREIYRIRWQVRDVARGGSQVYTAHLWKGASREPGRDKGIVCAIPESISTQVKRAHPRPALPFCKKKRGGGEGTSAHVC